MLKRLLRFMSTTRNHGLVYDFGPKNTNPRKIYGLYDSAHADCPDTRKSTNAYNFFLAGCPISWNTKLHTYVTTSTNHSEYCAAAKAAREAVWLQNIALALGLPKLVRPINLYSDSKGAIGMVYNPVLRSASKHVDLADHYAREQPTSSPRPSAKPYSSPTRPTSRGPFSGPTLMRASMHFSFLFYCLIYIYVIYLSQFLYIYLLIYPSFLLLLLISSY